MGGTVSRGIEMSGKIGNYYQSHKQHIFELPIISQDVSKIFQYTYGDEIALGLPIFGTHKPTDKGYEIYAKTAVWTALRFLYATDAVEQGVPIYFLIGDLCAQEIHSYLDQAGIPNVLRIPCPQTDKMKFVTKWSGIFNEALKKYSRIVVLDVDTIPFKRGIKYELFSHILAEWDIFSERIMLPGGNKASSRPPVWVRNSIIDLLGDEEVFWEQVVLLEKKFHVDNVRHIMTDPNVFSPFIGGWFAGFSKELRQDAQFQDVFFQLSDMAHTESTILEIWLILSKEKVKKIGPRIAWRYDQLSDISTLSRFYTSKGYEWRDLWHKDNLEVLTWALKSREKAKLICQQ